MEKIRGAIINLNDSIEEFKGYLLDENYHCILTKEVMSNSKRPSSYILSTIDNTKATLKKLEDESLNINQPELIEMKGTLDAFHSQFVEITKNRPLSPASEVELYQMIDKASDTIITHKKVLDDFIVKNGGKVDNTMSVNVATLPSIV